MNNEKENLREVKEYFEHIHSLVYATENESLRNKHNKAYQIVYDMLNSKEVSMAEKSIIKREEQIALLKKSVVEWNEWRKKNPEVIPNLSDANLSDANLSRANLSHADLSHANLSHADLSDANLYHTKGII